MYTVDVFYQPQHDVNTEIASTLYAIFQRVAKEMKSEGKNYFEMSLPFIPRIGEELCVVNHLLRVLDVRTYYDLDSYSIRLIVSFDCDNEQI